MLVISRKPEQWIRIGPDILICVTGTKSNQVTLGIDAPRSIKVERFDSKPPCAAKPRLDAQPEHVAHTHIDELALRQQAEQE